MNETDILQWFENHPDAARGNAQEIVQRCERAVRRHAIESAWLAAKGYVEQRRRDWADDWGYHASEAFVAREVCHQLAWELRRHEPAVLEGEEDRLAGGVVRRSLSPEGWAFLRAWIRELAEEEEHRAWREIVRFTDRFARSLIQDRDLSYETAWDSTRSYPAIAAEIASILAREYSLHAYPRN